jgi:8-oxo-dGTP pyrophosphatase MutT (NUDIX family)
MAWKPDVTVAAIIERDGRFLIVEERIRNRLVFNQPAGHLEEGETLAQAAIREAREETGWCFTPEALLGVYLWRNPGNGRGTLRFAFTGGASDYDATLPLDAGIIAAHWLTREQLASSQRRLRSPLVLRCIDDYLTGRRLPLDALAALDLHGAEQVSPVVSL